MIDTLKVVKGNCEYRIPSHKKQEYLDMGYSVLGDGGDVIVEGHPVTLADHKQRIAELDAENAHLKDVYKQLQKEYDALNTAYHTLEASVSNGTNKSTTKKKEANNCE